MLVSCLTYSSTLKMKSTYSSETSVRFQRTTPLYIPEDINLHNHQCESLMSYLLSFLLLYWRYNPISDMASATGSCPAPLLHLTFCFNLSLRILMNTNKREGCRDILKKHIALWYSVTSANFRLDGVTIQKRETVRSHLRLLILITKFTYDFTYIYNEYICFI
jgi:hypothetical protein